jgi:hypothetical protein
LGLATCVVHSGGVRFAAGIALLLLVGNVKASSPEVSARPRHDHGARLAQVSERVPRLFLRAINDLIRGTIRADRIKFLPPSSLLLEDALLLGPTGHRVAILGRAKLRLAITPLLAGNIVIRELEIDDPSLELRMEDGELTLLEALSPKKASKDGKPPPDVEVRIDELVVRGGRFSFSDESGLKVSARGIAARANLQADVRAATIVVNVSSGSAEAGRVDVGELQIPLRALHIDHALMLNDRVAITGARGEAAGASVKGGGSVAWGGAGRLDLRGRVEAPAGTWLQGLAPPPFAMPAASAEVSVTGPFKDVVVGAAGAFERFDAFGYRVDGGQGRVSVRADRLDVEAARLRLGKGSVFGEGSVLFEPGTLSLDGRVEELSLQSALGSTKLDELPRGSLSGTYRLHGPYDVSKGALAVTADLSARRVHWAQITPPTPLAVKAQLEVGDKRVWLTRVQAEGKGLRADASGLLQLDTERLELEVSADVERPLRMIADMPPRLTVTRARFTGTARGPFAGVEVRGDVEVPSGAAFGVPASALRASLLVDSRQVRLDRVRGELADGPLSADLRMTLPTRKGQAAGLAGAFRVAASELSRVTLEDGAPAKIGGRAGLTGTVAGTVKRPVIEAHLEIDDATVQDEALGRARAELLITKERLEARALSVRGPLLRARSREVVSLAFDDLSLGGDMDVWARDLSQIRAAAELSLQGHAQGRARLGGSLEALDISAWLEVSELGLRELSLGDGPLFVRLHPDARAGATGGVVEASGRLLGASGLVEGQASWALETAELNTALRLVEVDLHPLVTLLRGAPDVAGLVTGRVHLWGPLDGLEGRVSLGMPELAFLDPSRKPTAEGPQARPLDRVQLPRVADEMRASRARGPITLEGSLERGRLDALLCAFPRAGVDDVGPCGDAERVWLRAMGTLDPRRETYDLHLRGYVDESHLGRYVPALQELSATAALVATGFVDLKRAPGQDSPDVRGVVDLLAARIEVEDAPPGVLQESARVVFEGDTMRFEDTVRFAVGDSVVALSGYVGPQRQKLQVDGTVLLALAKLYVPEISQASGTVVAHLGIESDHGTPKFTGSIAPNPGAMLTLRTLRQRIEMLGGQIAFRPADAPTTRSVAERVTLEDLTVLVGDGQARLGGAFTVVFERPEDSEPRWRLEDWQLLARGEGIRVRQDRSWLEAAFNLRLEQRAGVPFLSGEAEVTDGLLRERFELVENFVITRAKRPSEPLHETLAPFGLADLRLDVNLAVRDFRVRAEIITFPLDGALMGNLRLGGSVHVPSAAGALEVIEGFVDFPRARFEFTDSQVEFLPERASFNPRLSIQARSELPPGRTGCDADVPALLFFRGDSLDEFRMDLEAEGQGMHSRNDLFRAVLFGQRLPMCDAAIGQEDASFALRAFSGEFTAGLTRQLEATIAERFGGELQVLLFAEAKGLGTDVRWQLGRRLVFEGETPLYTWGQENNAAASTAHQRENIGASNLRLRLLLFDHLPPNDGELFLEGALQSREDVITRDTDAVLEGRLKYRLFEY